MFQNKKFEYCFCIYYSKTQFVSYSNQHIDRRRKKRAFPTLCCKKNKLPLRIFFSYKWCHETRTQERWLKEAHQHHNRMPSQSYRTLIWTKQGLCCLNTHPNEEVKALPLIEVTERSTNWAESLHLKWGCKLVAWRMHSTHRSTVF